MLIPLAASAMYVPVSVAAPEAMAVNGFMPLGRGVSGRVTVTIDPDEVPEGTTDIKYQLDGGTAVSSGGTTTFDVDGLTNDQLYELALIMSNAGGDSDPTPEIPCVPRASAITVSSTSDGTGAGTLRNALSTSGSRAVIIDAAGEHLALSQIPIAANCTIINDSDTHYITGARLQSNSGNNLFYNLTAYAGTGEGSNTRQGDAIVIGSDAGSISNIYSVHCDYQGGIDENLSVYADPGTGGPVSNVRFYDCQLAGALTYACHYEGAFHDFGVQNSDLAHTGIRYVRCFFGYCEFRAPQFSAANLIGSVVDCLIWNVKGNAASMFDGNEIDFAGCRVKRGLYSDTTKSMLCDDGGTQFSWINSDAQTTYEGAFSTNYGDIFRVRAGGTALVGDGSDTERSATFINSNNNLLQSFGDPALTEAHVLAHVGRRKSDGTAFAFNQKMLDEYVSGGAARALDTGDFARTVYGNWTATGVTATAAGIYWTGADIGEEDVDQYTIYFDIAGIDAWITANPAGQQRFVDLFGRMQVEIAGSTGRLSGYHRDVGNTVRVDWNMTTSLAGTAGRVCIACDMRSGGAGLKIWVDETDITGSLNFSSGAQNSVGNIDFGRNAMGVLCEDNGANPATIGGINSFLIFAGDGALGTGNYGGLVNPEAFYRGGARARPDRVGKSPLICMFGAAGRWNAATNPGVTPASPTVVGTFS